MAIRVEHQPSAGAVGMAAYATGMGRRQERLGKYALDQWERKRAAHQRAVAARGRARGGGQAGGVWSNPMAGLEVGQEAVEMRSQMRANERAQRMGKQLPHPDAQSKFTSQDELDDARDRKRELEDEQREREQEIEDRGFAAGQARAKVESERRYGEREKRFETSGHTSEEQSEIHKKSAELNALKRSERLSPQDEDKRQAEIARREAELAALWNDPHGEKPLTPDEHATANIRQLPNGTWAQWNEKERRFDPLPTPPAEKEDTSAADAAKKTEGLRKDVDAWKKKVYDQANDFADTQEGTPNYKRKKERLELLQGQLDQLETALDQSIIDSLPAPEPKQPGLGAQQGQQDVDRAADKLRGFMESLPGNEGMLDSLTPAAPPVEEPARAAIESRVEIVNGKERIIRDGPDGKQMWEFGRGGGGWVDVPDDLPPDWERRAP